MSLFLVFLFIFSLQTLEDSDNFYVIFESADENPTFSSYRLSNPERIVFEANGSFEDTEISDLPQMVRSVEKNVSGGMTRFVFFVEQGAQYTFFNRKGTIVIAFSRSVFLDDDNFDTIMAKFTAHREAQRIAQAENERKAEEERIAEEERRAAEEKRIEDLKKEYEERRLAEEKRIEELKKAEDEKRVAEEKRIAELKKAEDDKKLAAEREAELVNSLMNELAEEERTAELKKAEEEKRLAEEKRIAELKKAEEERRLAEEKRIAELKKAEEERRLAEEKRIAELKKAEEERRLAEEKRIAELKRAEEEKRVAEEKRIAELKKAEEEKRTAERMKAVRSEDGKILQLKVRTVGPEPTLSEKLPELPVTKLEKKGKLKNIFFRKFPEFSRVTMELDGEVDYQFREISGGFVIDVHNFDKIPQYLLNIIDTRAFKAEVAYIYPKKADDILKIYIKTDPGMAVRKSVDGKYVNFDFFRPSIE